MKKPFERKSQLHLFKILFVSCGKKYAEKNLYINLWSDITHDQRLQNHEHHSQLVYRAIWETENPHEYFLDITLISLQSEAYFFKIDAFCRILLVLQ